MLASQGAEVKQASYINAQPSLQALWKNGSYSSIRGGASGAATMRVNGKHFVKYDAQRTPQEIKGQRTMKQLLPQHTIPFLEADADTGMVCMPLLMCDLDTAVKRSKFSKQMLVELYDDFLQQMSRLWVSSRSHIQPSPSRHLQRMQEKTTHLQQRYATTFAGLPQGFAALSQMEMEIDGDRYPSLQTLKQRAKTILTQNIAPVSVTAHRDEHAKNIMIHPVSGANRPQWMLVDYPDVMEKSDWVWSIVKMRSWWQLGSVIDLLKQPSRQQMASKIVNISRVGERLNITTDLQKLTPSLCPILDQRVQQTAVHVAQQFQDGEWQERYQALMFYCYYCLLAHYGPKPQLAALLMAEAAKVMAGRFEKVMWK